MALPKELTATHFHSPASWRVSLRTVRRYTPLSCSKTWREDAEICWSPQNHFTSGSGRHVTAHTHTRSQSKCSLAITVLHTDTKEASASNATGKESNSVQPLKIRPNPKFHLSCNVQVSFSQFILEKKKGPITTSQLSTVRISLYLNVWCSKDESLF